MRPLAAMTVAELRSFVLEVRAEADARLAILHAVDPDTLPPELQDEYRHALQDWTELRRMTDDEVTRCMRRRAGR